MIRWFFCVMVIAGFWQPVNSQDLTATSGHIQKKIHADLIVIKLKNPESTRGRIANSSEEHLQEIKDLIGYKSDYQVFSPKAVANGRIASSNLQSIYKLKFDHGTNIWKALTRLKDLDYIEYAEPLFQNEILLVPNDPQADPSGGQQDYLTVIKAYDGWQIDQSDSAMVIGIVDTGVNMSHEDLDNVAYNTADPINGIDDDGDGYIDNYRGWDVANGDNDPSTDNNGHGTFVAGLSSAETNNGIGMAGIGFNSTYLPVNAWNSTYSTLLNEYEGIIYAADHGAKVINLSWGGPDLYSQYGQDIINYAVFEKDAVVIAAAGNTHQELQFYPASFENVLSVGATDMGDNMANWATYSHFIDVMAPGQQIYSTANNGGYSESQGSSFATPIVAGAAALVRSHFPELSALQVMEQLRVTSDDIYSVGSNMNYYGKMGKGRLNVERALSDTLTPAIRVSQHEFNGNYGNLIFPGDSVSLTLTFTNHLRLAENVTITITNPSSNVSGDLDPLYVDKLFENESFDNNDSPLQFMVNENIAESERLIFRIDYVGNNYVDFEYIEIQAAPAHFNISDGNLTATITSDGDIGYDWSYYRYGDGVNYQENHIASNTGLIISVDSMHVLDNVINDFQNFTRDEDFKTETSLRLFDNSVADDDARSVFIPVDQSPTSLDIKVEQKVLAWENQTDDGYLIFEYRIINIGDSSLSGLSAGLYADWDLGDFQSNAAAWDATEEFGYIFDKAIGNSYAGVALISNQDKAHYAIDLDSLNGNTADLGSIFSSKLKHEFLSQSTKDAAGSNGAGNDVAHIVGGKAMTLAPNQSAKVAIAMLSSTSLEGLRNALSKARTKYGEYQANPPLLERFFSCSGDSALVDPKGDIFEFYEDAAGTVRIDSGYSMKTAPLEDTIEIYVVNLDSGFASDLAKIIVQPKDAEAMFSMSPDTLLMENGQSSTLTLLNNSLKSDQWHWDFGNGYSSTVAHPQTIYDTPGIYNIELIASNTYGCSDTLQQNLLVAIRSDRPLVQEQEICKGAKASISASNTNLLKVYSDAELSELLYVGDVYETAELYSNTTFYVVNVDAGFESLEVAVNVNVNQPTLGFEYLVDTTVLKDQYVMLIRNTMGEVENVSWMIDGHFVTNELSFSHRYDQSAFEIMQIKTNAQGCADTLRQMVVPEASEIPVMEDVQVCMGDMYFITPQNGELFYFYADEGLTQLLHKGSSFAVSNVLTSTEYYVTGVDNFLEGPPASINIDLDPVEAVIQPSVESIDLATIDSVLLSDLSANALRSYWLSKGGTFDTTKVITETYSEPGIYDYVLVAESSSGCYDTAYQSVEVIIITGFSSESFANVNFYPNPVVDDLVIDLGEKARETFELEIIDMYGGRQGSITIPKGQSSQQVSLYYLKSGVYFVRSIHSKQQFQAKILKR